MASILKVDTIQDQSGNNIINESGDTITIGASGDTITIPSGASMTVPNGGLSGQNYPAFQASLVASQNITNNTVTTGQYSIEGFDTDGCYDTGTYRFTPTTAGKYVIGLVQRTDNFNASRILAAIRKNGNNAISVEMGNGGNYDTLNGSAIVTFNGTTDYVDCALYQNSGTTQTFQGGPGSEWGSLFFGYRIGS
jgi:hypothetical protein